MSFAAMMVVAILCDLALGWPDWIYRRVGHPVTWLGAVIFYLDHAWNRGRWARFKGVAAAAVVIALAVLSAGIVQELLPDGLIGVVIGGIVAWPLVALRSMHDHVRAVATPLVQGDLHAARAAVAMIVGRSPDQLDQAGVARAAIESLAENTSDGIVAPLFWGLVAGLPGIAAYKAINTLDSMIGHRTDRHEAFGWASARIDDLVNLIPARLTGLIFAVVSRHPLFALQAMARDARHHRSPNAGWPEAAMAGGLGVRLSGPRVYGDQLTDDAYVNAHAPDPQPVDLARGLDLYRRAMGAWCGAIALLAIVGGI
ncbi:cobalamin biosynthesis protein CobD [Thioclava sp. SK-1]|uniref:adenosylcobinamide-phosphate synthase CbiB n=1 Tax=Thioclava sp. SK-1 TaxID=1889770 RepID=UPI0008271826|nr:adenosylcobinamide-phosphate synthase CbiB [Thioclava sp. SK-1]OCX65979.1 cobalamin biosynthesis protein CobD [Thioclava sp. SK-1]